MKSELGSVDISPPLSSGYGEMSTEPNPIQCPDCVYPGKQRSNSAAGLCSKPAPKDCWGRPMPTLVALQM